MKSAVTVDAASKHFEETLNMSLSFCNFGALLLSHIQLHLCATTVDDPVTIPTVDRVSWLLNQREITLAE